MSCLTPLARSSSCATALRLGSISLTAFLFVSAALTAGASGQDVLTPDGPNQALFAEDSVEAKVLQIKPQPLELTSIWDDGFRQDSRREYRSANPDKLLWQPGNLTLPERSYLERELGAGGWFKLKWELDRTSLERPAELRLIINRALRYARDSEGATKLTLVWTESPTDEGGQTDLKLLESRGLGGISLGNQVVGQWKLDESLSGRWTVEYRYGCLSISTPQGQQLVSNPDNPFSQCPDFRLYAAQGDFVLHQFSAAAVPAIEYDTLKRQGLLSSALASERADKAFASGDSFTALTEAREAMRFAIEELGPLNPATLLMLRNLGWTYIISGDVQRARALSDATLAMFEMVYGAEHSQTALALDQRSRVCLDVAEFDEAERSIERAIDIKEKLLGKNHPDVFFSLQQKAYNSQQIGRLTDTKKQLEALLGRAEEFPNLDEDSIATLLHNLAAVQRELGHFGSAYKLYLEAYEIEKRLGRGEHPQTANTLNSIGIVLFSMGDTTRAVEYYEQALDLMRGKIPESHPQQLMAQTNLATAYLDTHQYDRAEAAAAKVLELTRAARSKNHWETAKALTGLSSVYLKQSRPEEALKLLAEAEQIFRAQSSENSTELGPCLTNMATALIRLGRVAEAEQRAAEACRVYEAAGSIYGEKYRVAVLLRAMVHEKTGEFAEALPWIEKMIASSKQSYEEAALAQSEHQQLLYGKMLRFDLDHYLVVAAKLPNYHTQAYEEVLAWKGATMLRQSRYRRLTKDPVSADTLSRLQSVSAELSQLLLSPPSVPSQSTQPQSEIVLRRSDAWQKRVNELRAEREQLERQLAARSVDYNEVAQRASVTDIQAALRDHTALIDFLHITVPTDPQSDGPLQQWKSTLLAFVVTEDQLQLIHLDLSVEDVSSLVAAWRQGFGVSSAALQAAKELRERIWLPVEQHLTDIQTVIVSNDGPLATLPLGALPGTEPGSFLIEEYQIGYLPVPRLLPQLQNPRSVKRDRAVLLALGNIDYDGPPTSGSQALSADADAAPFHFRRLTQTGKEVREIAALFQSDVGPDAEVTILEEHQATAAAVRSLAPQATVIHIATHGFSQLPTANDSTDRDLHAPTADPSLADDRAAPPADAELLSGVRSGLALSGSNRHSDDSTDDGILTALEVSYLPLQHVELVTLSACETGLGDVTRGEGLMGLQRAFQIAGAQATVASLWAVDDAATQALMKEFYTKLWQNKLDGLAALHQAQLKMLTSYDPKSGEVRGIGGQTVEIPPIESPGVDNPYRHRLSPRFWAAFQLSGDWR